MATSTPARRAELNSLPGIGRRFSSTRGALDAGDVAVPPTTARVAARTRGRRLPPGWRRCRILVGQYGHTVSLSSFSADALADVNAVSPTGRPGGTRCRRSRGRVAAADDDDMLAAGPVGLLGRGRPRRRRGGSAGPGTAWHTCSPEGPYRKLGIARTLGADGQQHRVMALLELVDRQVDARHWHRNGRRRLRPICSTAAVDVVLFHLKSGMRSASGRRRAARARRHAPCGRRGPAAGPRQGRRAGADDGDGLAGAERRRLGADPPFGPGLVGNPLFHGLDGDRHVLEVQRAGFLARGGADAAGELGEVLVECRLRAASSQSPL